MESSSVLQSALNCARADRKSHPQGLATESNDGRWQDGRTFCHVAHSWFRLRYILSGYASGSHIWSQKNCSEDENQAFVSWTKYSTIRAVYFAACPREFAAVRHFEYREDSWDGEISRSFSSDRHFFLRFISRAQYRTCSQAIVVEQEREKGHSLV